MTGNGLLQLRQEIDGLTDAIVIGIKARSMYGKADECDSLFFNQADQNVLRIYFGSVNYFCSGDNQDYGKHLADARNLDLISRRISIGEKVARTKLESDLELWTIKDSSQIRSRMTNREREKEVVSRALTLGMEQELPNYERIGDLIREVISLTLDLEVDFIEKAQSERDNLRRVQSLGWGNYQRVNSPSRIGWR